MYTEKQVAAVLKACNIKPAGELEDEFLVFCPFHNNYRSPAAEVHKETGRLYCFACHTSASLVEVVQKAKEQTFFQASRLIDSKSENHVREIKLEFEAPPVFVQFDNALIQRLHANVFQERPLTYLAGRGITEASAGLYEIGYSQVQDMVTIPVHAPDGMCVGFVGRSIEGKAFKNSDGLPKAKTCFNLHRRKFSDTIYVVESTFDAIRIEQCGHYAIALLGSASKHQVSLIERTFRSAILVPDADDAGKLMANKMVSKMGNTRLTVANLPANVKDVGELDDATLRAFLQSSTDITIGEK